ncbi:hypothetical protein [Longispora urticae]
MEQQCGADELIAEIDDAWKTADAERGSRRRPLPSPLPETEPAGSGPDR